MKKLFSAVIAAIMVLTISSIALAKDAPLRVAMVPIQFQNSSINDSAVQDVTRQLERAAHVPLNGVLERVDYIDQHDVYIAYDKCCSVAMSKDCRYSPKYLTEDIAKELDADIVILPIVRNTYNVYYYYGWYTQQISSAEFVMYIYDAAAGDTQEYKSSNRYSDQISINNNAESLLKSCVYKVIQKSDISHMLLASKD